jgi:cytidyltransferase-like protein
MAKVIVTGHFDNIRSWEVRFMHEASRWGEVHALLWSDLLIQQRLGKAPKFPLTERLYFLGSLRFVSQVTALENFDTLGEILKASSGQPVIWAMEEGEDPSPWQAFCQSHEVEVRFISQTQRRGFPLPLPGMPKPFTGAKKVIVTGCYDWLHSGHVRFFEEAAELGDLIVAVGNDINVRFLKGEGHPLFSQEERLYMVSAVRHVHTAVLTSGMGWMDAEPEVKRLKPDIYVVNEDGDKPEKRAFCAQYGLEYVVLKRLPKEGLPRRESTQLRGY